MIASPSGNLCMWKTLVITSSHWNQMEMERGKKKTNTWKVTMVQLVCISSLGSRFRCVAWAIFQLRLELKLQVAGSSILPKHNYSAGNVIHGNTHTIHAWYIIPSWMVDFYGFHVGKYTILHGSYGICSTTLWSQGNQRRPKSTAQESCFPHRYCKNHTQYQPTTIDIQTCLIHHLAIRSGGINKLLKVSTNHLFLPKKGRAMDIW